MFKTMFKMLISSLKPRKKQLNPSFEQMFIKIAKVLSKYYLFRTLYKIYSAECAVVKN